MALAKSSLADADPEQEAAGEVAGEPGRDVLDLADDPVPVHHLELGDVGGGGLMGHDQDRGIGALVTVLAHLVNVRVATGAQSRNVNGFGNALYHPLKLEQCRKKISGSG